MSPPQRDVFRPPYTKQVPYLKLAPLGSIFTAPSTRNILYLFGICPPRLVGKIQTLCFLSLADFPEPGEVPGHTKGMSTLAG